MFEFGFANPHPPVPCRICLSGLFIRSFTELTDPIDLSALVGKYFFQHAGSCQAAEDIRLDERREAVIARSER